MKFQFYIPEKVYEAYKIINTEKKFVIKRILIQTLLQNKELEVKFLKEVEILFRCKNENVIRCFDYLQSEKYFYIILEAYNCKFEQLLESRRILEEPEAFHYLKQIINGLKGLHELGVVHSSLSLSDLYIHEGMLKIYKLGFLKQFFNEFYFKKNKVENRNNYPYLGCIAPEVIEGEKYGVQADMWSLGSILYKMLYGTYPFSIKGNQSFINDIRSRKVPNLEVLGGFVSSSLKELLTKMLDYDPKGRMKFIELYDHPLIKEKIGGRVEINPQMLKRDFRLNEQFYFYNDVDDLQNLEAKNIIKKNEINGKLVQERKIDENLQQIIELNQKFEVIEQKASELFNSYLIRRNLYIFLANIYDLFYNDNPRTDYLYLIMILKGIQQKAKFLYDKIKEKINFLNSEESVHNKMLQKIEYQQLEKIIKVDLRTYTKDIKFLLENKNFTQSQKFKEQFQDYSNPDVDFNLEELAMNQYSNFQEQNRILLALILMQLKENINHQRPQFQGNPYPILSGQIQPNKENKETQLQQGQEIILEQGQQENKNRGQNPRKKYYLEYLNQKQIYPNENDHGQPLNLQEKPLDIKGLNQIQIIDFMFESISGLETAHYNTSVINLDLLQISLRQFYMTLIDLIQTKAQSIVLLEGQTSILLKSSFQNFKQKVTQNYFQTKIPDWVNKFFTQFTENSLNQIDHQWKIDLNIKNIQENIGVFSYDIFTQMKSQEKNILLGQQFLIERKYKIIFRLLKSYLVLLDRLNRGLKIIEEKINSIEIYSKQKKYRIEEDIKFLLMFQEKVFPNDNANRKGFFTKIFPKCQKKNEEITQVLIFETGKKLINDELNSLKKLKVSKSNEIIEKLFKYYQDLQKRVQLNQLDQQSEQISSEDFREYYEQWTECNKIECILDEMDQIKKKFTLQNFRAEKIFLFELLSNQNLNLTFSLLSQFFPFLDKCKEGFSQIEKKFQKLKIHYESIKSEEHEIQLRNYIEFFFDLGQNEKSPKKKFIEMSKNFIENRINFLNQQESMFWNQFNQSFDQFKKKILSSDRTSSDQSKTNDFYRIFVEISSILEEIYNKWEVQQNIQLILINTKDILKIFPGQDFRINLFDFFFLDQNRIDDQISFLNKFIHLTTQYRNQLEIKKQRVEKMKKYWDSNQLPNNFIYFMKLFYLHQQKISNINQHTIKEMNENFIQTTHEIIQIEIDQINNQQIRISNQFISNFYEFKNKVLVKAPMKIKQSFQSFFEEFTPEKFLQIFKDSDLTNIQRILNEFQIKQSYIRQQTKEVSLFAFLFEENNEDFVSYISEYFDMERKCEIFKTQHDQRDSYIKQYFNSLISDQNLINLGELINLFLIVIKEMKLKNNSYKLSSININFMEIIKSMINNEIQLIQSKQSEVQNNLIEYFDQIYEEIIQTSPEEITIQLKKRLNKYKFQVQIDFELKKLKQQQQVIISDMQNVQNLFNTQEKKISLYEILFNKNYTYLIEALLKLCQSINSSHVIYQNVENKFIPLKQKLDILMSKLINLQNQKITLQIENYNVFQKQFQEFLIRGKFKEYNEFRWENKSVVQNRYQINAQDYLQYLASNQWLRTNNIDFIISYLNEKQEILSSSPINECNIIGIIYFELGNNLIFKSTFWTFYQSGQCNLENQVKMTVDQEKKLRNKKFLSDFQTVCAPVNISDQHWIMVSYSKQKDEQMKVQVMDSAQAMYGKYAPSVISGMKKLIVYDNPNRKDENIIYGQGFGHQQNNGSDCGCYVLHNIMCKINGKLQSKLPLDFRKRMYNLTLFVDNTPSNKQLDLFMINWLEGIDEKYQQIRSNIK